MAWATLRRRGAVALGLGLGIATGRVGYPAAALTRLMIAGDRQPIRRTPADVGLQYEDVVFPSHDGVTLRGWFVRRANDDGARAPAIVFVHGWPWNRLGNQAGRSFIPDRSVDLFVPARALAEAGFHVLLFDLRNHGQSDAALPVTFGVNEARDFVGAVAMLRKRPDVDRARIGAIGYSMGANAIIYGIPRCQHIRAAVAVQPTSLAIFAPRMARAVLGPAGPLLAQLAEPLYQAFGAPSLDQIAPARAARHLDETKMLYIQGSGDPWGTLADVQAICDATPNVRPIVIAPSTDRFGGYLYVNENPSKIVEFFEEHLR
ncbi:MAG TPA: alpha/beta fold hydrolase [Roseiflexaceae bacterium]